MSQAPTIAAIASPPGGGLRGIVRISGALAREVVAATWAGAAPPDLSRRGLHVGRFRDGRGEQPLLLLWMPAPHSFTREDVAELHLPGSPPLLQAALEHVLSLGVRPAAPGEFTRRAFLSGRIDLTRAEGLLALISARSEGERRAGRALLSGGLADRVLALREQLSDLRALVEASLDFDERDTGHVPAQEIESLARETASSLARALEWETARAVSAGEPRAVLAGRPNAGKSSLFNRLAGRQAAIVSPEPGTTRDFLTAHLDLAGSPVRLFDTAGAEELSAVPAIDAADLILWVVDATDARSAPEPPRREDLLLVWNKIDLAGAAQAPPAHLDGFDWVATSAASGAGLDRLLSAMARHLGPDGEGCEGAGLSRELSARHKRALEEASRALAEGLAAWAAGASLEILAENLRAATAALDDVSGATTSEDVLDRIFARFCLGK